MTSPAALLRALDGHLAEIRSQARDARDMIAGYHDPVLAHLDTVLDGIAARPAMYAQSAEALLLQALLALDARALLLGGEDCRGTYFRLLNERFGGSSLAASDHLDHAGTAAFVADLTQRERQRLPDPTHRTPPPRAAVAPGEALPPPAAPEPAPPVPAPAQGALPGFEPPVRVRRATNHRFGLLRTVTVPATGIVPEHLAAVETCPHCATQRKRDNVGKRLGSKWLFSTDGKAWSQKSPPCRVKR